MFYDWLETHSLTPASISLWHGLMHIANRSGWRSPLHISSSLIELRTGISRSTLKRERAKLVEAGLLVVEFGKGRGRTSYELRSLSSQLVVQFEPQNTENEFLPDESVQFAVQIEPQDEPQNVPNRILSDQAVQLTVHNEPQTVPPIIYKLNYTESNKEPTTNREQSSLLELPRCEGGRRSQKSEKEDSEKMEVAGEPAPSLSSSPERKEKSSGKKEKKVSSPHLDTDAILQTIEPPWSELMHTWLEYKRIRKESYRSEIGIRKCLTMLRNLSGGNLATAAAIIDQSIANNWAGLFELKQQAYTPRGQPTPNRGQSNSFGLPRCEGGRRSQPATGQHIGQIKQPETEEHKNRILEKFGKPKK